DGLLRPDPAAVAIPGEFGTHDDGPRSTGRPLHRRLRGHPQRAWITRRGHAFRSNLVFERRRHRSGLAFDDAVRKETPEPQVGVGLMWPVQDRLLDRHTIRRFVGELTAE